MSMTTDSPAATFDVFQDPEAFRALYIRRAHVDDEQAIKIAEDYLEKPIKNARVRRYWWRFIPGDDGAYSGYYHECSPGRGASKVTEIEGWDYDNDR